MPTVIPTTHEAGEHLQTGFLKSSLTKNFNSGIKFISLLFGSGLLQSKYAGKMKGEASISCNAYRSASGRDYRSISDFNNERFMSEWRRSRVESDR